MTHAEYSPSGPRRVEHTLLARDRPTAETHLCARLSDGRHGGRQPAFQAAKLCRDALVTAHPPLSKPAYCAIRKKNNRSGISGLMRVDTWQVHNGRRSRRLHWEAQWPIGNGKARHQKFSITKYGEEGAKRKALAARRAALKALATQTFPSVKASL